MFFPFAARLPAIWEVDGLHSRIVDDSSAVLGMERRYGDAVQSSFLLMSRSGEPDEWIEAADTLQESQRRRCLRLGNISHSCSDLLPTCRPPSPSSSIPPFLDSSLISTHVCHVAGRRKGPQRRDGKRKRANGNANAPKDTQTNQSAGRIFTDAPVHHVHDEHASLLAHKHDPAAHADAVCISCLYLLIHIGGSLTNAHE